MKDKIIFSTIVIIGILAVFSERVFTNAGTPPTARTGAPGETTCSGCHGGASGIGGTIDFDGGSSKYIPGQTYTINVTGESGTKNGFEMVILRDSDDTNIGSITTTNTTNTASVTAGSRTYISHKNADGNNTWSYDWTAPSSDEGSITFYLAVNKADGNGSSFGGSGDLIYTNTLSITPAIVCSTAMFTVTTGQSDATCNTGNDGSGAVTVTGGTSSFTYIWSNGATTQMIDSLTQGNYTVTITDGYGCDTSTTITVGGPSAITVSTIDQADASCGNNDGKISVSAAGGTPPYSYSWDNGDSDSTLTGLAAATYSLTVLDANGCQWVKTYNISDAGAPSIYVISKNNVICFGDDDGTITISVDGGIEPYTYSWSTNPAQTTETAIGLSGDIYNIDVTDSLNCKSIKAITITEPEELSISINDKANVTCYGHADGFVDVLVTGGISPYSYLWSTGSTNEYLTSLSGAKYYVTVTDANGCVDSNKATVSEPDSLYVVIDFIENPDSIGFNSPWIVFIDTIGGGITPYTYKWSDDSSTTNDTLIVSSGLFLLTITDANGCVFVSNIINAPVIESIYEHFKPYPINIYPNPTKGTFTINLSNLNPLNSELNIYDILGNRIDNINLNNDQTKFTIDLNKLNCDPGLYFIELKGNIHAIRKKILYTQ
ncbi:MAG: T9SS type A sorting domain-containing protein [Bacteroidia bacterium]|nr:T9SS type A sorting domain-containing protein [Bacteroidia bacterium]